MKRVLLIEDNDDDIELAQRAFAKAGLEIRLQIARTGEEALDYLLGRGSFADAGPAPRIQLILLDLNLPKIPGLDVLRQIRLNPQTSQLPVIVMTISRKEPDLLQSFTMGASDYLIKPLNPEKFAAIYQKYVKERMT
jgi:two-component system response regulator